MTGPGIIAFLTARLDELTTLADAMVTPPPGYPSTPYSAKWCYADADAKKEIIKLHALVEVDYIDADGDDRTSRDCAECRTHGVPDTWPCLTLCLLALPYADHPDYDAERWP